MTHDDDAAFTWEYAADPAAAATTLGACTKVASVDKLDSHTVKVVFQRPTPFWPVVFCGTGMILPRDRRPSR